MQIKKGKPCWNKSEIAEKIATKTKCPKQVVNVVLNALFVVLEEILMNDEQAEFKNFGRFYRKTKPAYWSKTFEGEPKWVEDTHYIMLKHAFALKCSLNRHKTKYTYPEKWAKRNKKNS